jgi:hypothetical protein
MFWRPYFRYSHHKKINYSLRSTKLRVISQTRAISLFWTPLFNYELYIQVSSLSTVEETTYCRCISASTLSHEKSGWRAMSAWKNGINGHVCEAEKMSGCLSAVNCEWSEEELSMDCFTGDFRTQALPECYENIDK